MRKRRAVKRDVLADPIYKSKVVAKLINTIMLDGKKGIAQSRFYSGSICMWTCDHGGKFHWRLVSRS